MALFLRKSSFATRLIDPFEPTREHAAPAYRWENANARAWGIPALLGVALLVLSVVGWVIDPAQFYFSYLVGWSFCLTITLGALFFLLVHHITRAKWSIVVRRIPEAMVWAFPVLAVLFIPIFFGMHDLYHWTHHEVMDPASPEYDALLAGKQPYLNVPFWIVRVLAYFAIWTYLAYRLYSLSLLQDVDPDREIPAKLRKVSAWGIPVFGITVAFASYDLLMSLDPHWFSTIFGVYIFAGSFWTANACIALLAILLQRYGKAARGVITTEHYHDLGKWMFAFTVFWAYIGFSQYMLIWYGNIPEETLWYRHRVEHGWGYHSAALIILHFILPFFILLPRASKRLIPILSVMIVWIFIMQWFDLHWLAMPVLDVARNGHAGFHWLSFTCWLGLFSLYLGLVFFRLGRHSLVPHNDPFLDKSIHFHNI